MNLYSKSVLFLFWFLFYKFLLYHRMFNPLLSPFKNPFRLLLKNHNHNCLCVLWNEILNNDGLTFDICQSKHWRESGNRNSNSNSFFYLYMSASVVFFFLMYEPYKPPGINRQPSQPACFIFYS